MQAKKDLRKLLVGWDSFLKTRINEAEEWQQGQERSSFSSGKEDMLAGFDPAEIKKIKAQVAKYFDFSEKSGDAADIIETKKQLIIDILKAKIPGANINPDNIYIATSYAGGFEGGKGGKYIGQEKAPTSSEKEVARGTSHKRGPAIAIFQKTATNNPEYIIYDNKESDLNDIANGLERAATEAKTGGSISTTTNIVNPSTGESKEVFTGMNSAPLAWLRFRKRVINTLLFKYARKSSEEGKRANMSSKNIKDVIDNLRPAIGQYPLVIGALFDAIEDPSSDTKSDRAREMFTSEEMKSRPNSKIEGETDEAAINAAMSKMYPELPWRLADIKAQLSPDNVENKDIAMKLIHIIGEAGKKLDIIQREYFKVSSEEIQKNKVHIYDFDNTLVNTSPMLAKLGISEQNSWKFLSYLTFLKQEYRNKILPALIQTTEPIKGISSKFTEDLATSPENTFIVSHAGMNPLRNKKGDIQTERVVTENDFVLWFRKKDPDLIQFLSSGKGLKNTAGAAAIKKMSGFEQQPQVAKTASVEAPKFGRDQYIAKYAEDQGARKYLINYLRWYGNVDNLSNLDDQQIADLEKHLKFVRGLSINERHAAAKQAIDSESEGLDALLSKVDAAIEQRNQADESQYEDGEEYDPNWDSDLYENKVKKVKSLRENIRPIRLRMVGR